jgi:hypothetical protein
LEFGTFVVLLKRYAFKQQGVALEVDVDCRQFPNRRPDLLLFEGKRASFLQSSQQPSSEGDIVHEVALDFADAMLLVIDHQVAGHATEDASLAGRRMEVRRGVKVQ